MVGNPTPVELQQGSTYASPGPPPRPNFESQDVGSSFLKTTGPTESTEELANEQQLSRSAESNRQEIHPSRTLKSDPAGYGSGTEPGNKPVELCESKTLHFSLCLCGFINKLSAGHIANFENWSLGEGKVTTESTEKLANEQQLSRSVEQNRQESSPSRLRSGRLQSPALSILCGFLRPLPRTANGTNH